ncbi:tetratricopeptide repeat protein [Mesobacillus zeae]|uniref:Tetratricopeptide repeat protein n=1 Tax=Mesobacillus zeae TaxID=1917180 RepID=A0A398B1P0_9BACI|nr:tetratricopeptide repeat protein [Mesobacillus zeae]RID83244.1 tetratricopeptide repeat protein [Mesobacillus zeae]
MEKHNPDSKNVIPFPGLESRLLEKGLHCLHDKKYGEAASLLEQAREMDPENSEIYIGLVMAYFESGHAREAKQLAFEMLKGGIGDYIETMDLYIMVLVQLNEYEEVVATIEALLEEREVPKEKLEHFSRLLDFSRRMAETKDSASSLDTVQPEISGEQLGLLDKEDPGELLQIIARLSKENVRPYIEEIRGYLSSGGANPFQKTLLLNILKEQEYGKELRVEKFGMTDSFVPAECADPRETEKLVAVGEILAEKLENDNPVLYDNIRGLAERSFFLLYPFDPEPVNPAAWAAACHYLGNIYHGNEGAIEDYARQYGVSLPEAASALEFIRKAEEISSPII